MLDLDNVVGFDWDAGNAWKSENKQGATQGEAELLFFSDPLLAFDEKHSREEARYHALGVINDGRRRHVTFTMRADGKVIRVISARLMSRKEREAYEQAG